MLSQLTQQLCLELQKGKFCYVTGSRPINRPSLCQHTCVQMAQHGYRNVIVSIPSLGDTADEKLMWDQHIMRSIWRSLHADNTAQLDAWLKTTQQLSPQARLNQFTSDLLLSDLCEGPFLICLDNIDGLFDVPEAFKGVLDWIAYCYELRDTYLTYRHLSIAVFGSIKPSHLKLKTYFSAELQPVFFQSPAGDSGSVQRRQLTSPHNISLQNISLQNFNLRIPVFG